MKSSVRKAKAKVGQLMVSLRPESRLQSPVSPDLDPGPALSVSPSPDTKSRQALRSPRDVSSQSSTEFMKSTQAAIAPSSVPHDLNPISPAALFGIQSRPNTPGDAVPGSVEMASSTTNASLRRVPVCMTRVNLSCRTQFLQIIVNSNQNATYNYGRDVINNNSVTSNIYLSNEEVWCLIGASQSVLTCFITGEHHENNQSR